jgi:predicted DNA-binding protein (UPF0251 family)
MLRVEISGRALRLVRVEGQNQYAVAREFGILRKTIQKLLRYWRRKGTSGSSQ